MSIITISRGSNSRGRIVAEKLADRLGYTCISREILLEASTEFNIPEFKLERALHDPPSALDRFSNGRERFISYLHSALLQYARRDNLVYHGLAGQFFLRNISHVYKVRIIADIEDRIRDEMQRNKVTSDEARYQLQKDDEERRRWALKLYGVDIWDCRLYDIVLNIKKLSIEDAVDVLSETVQKPTFQSTDASRQHVEDLALAARVKAVLVGRSPEIDVSSEQGRVFIHFRGPAADEQKCGEMTELAMGVDGVSEVLFSSAEPARQPNRINPFHKLG